MTVRIGTPGQPRTQVIYRTLRLMVSRSLTRQRHDPPRSPHQPIRRNPGCAAAGHPRMRGYRRGDEWMGGVMGRPDGIPQDVWVSADTALDDMLCNCIEASGSAEQFRIDSVTVIARAIMADRERASAACDVFCAPVSDSDFVNGQSTAAQQIRAAIRGGQ